MANTITAVGSAINTETTSGNTISVSPASVGNCLVVWGFASDTSAHFFSAISGGGVTAWTAIQSTTSYFSQYALAMWFGKVTAAGSATITLTQSGTFANDSWITVQEFTVGSSGAVWAIDGTQSATKSNGTASSSVTYPTLTPSGTLRMYVGGGMGLGSPALTTGQTSGYTVAAFSSSYPPVAMYNPSVANSAQSPVTAQTSSAQSSTMGALITGTIPAPAVGHPNYLLNVAMRRAALR